MNPEELEAWIYGHPLVMAYGIALIGGSLASMLVLIVRISRARRLGRHPVPAWRLSWLDFLLFVIALVCWFAISGLILLQVYNWTSEDGSDPGTGISVLGGFLLQAGMLYLYLRFRFHHRTPNEGPASPRILSLDQGFLLGFFYFLASLPVIYTVGAIWNLALEALRERGISIELPVQDAVLLFQQTENPFAFFGLILLAVVVAPVVEETVFRAGVYRFFKGKTSIPLALMASGLLFGMIHGNLQSLPGLVAVGICLGLAYELSGNIRVPIFFHAFFNLNSILWILLIPESFTG